MNKLSPEFYEKCPESILATITECPFCAGDGCCYCDHSGRIEVGNNCVFRTVSEAENHNPEISVFDLQVSRGERDLHTGKIKPT